MLRYMIIRILDNGNYRLCTSLQTDDIEQARTWLRNQQMLFIDNECRIADRAIGKLL